MKVFHIISRLDIGGAERVALNIASTHQTDVEMHLVEVVRAHDEVTKSLLAECRENGIQVHRFVFPNWNFHYLPQKIAAWMFPLWFVWVFLRYRPDVLHSHTEIPDLAVYSFCRFFPWLGKRVRIVRTIHNNVLWSGMHRTGRWVERFMQARKANVAISRSVKESYEKAYGEGVETLIYNGVEAPALKVNGERLRVNGERAFRVLFAGRWEQQKGIETLADIVRMADAEKWHFTLVGSGRQADLIYDVANGRGNVVVRTSIPSLVSHLSEYDFVLMPSLFEGLPLLAIEAGMAAVPVLANRAPGLTETLPEDWPLMVNGNSRSEWKALLERIEQGVDKDALGVRLQQFACEHFSLETMQRAYETLYRCL